jgi:hypothetical protein
MQLSDSVWERAHAIAETTLNWVINSETVTTAEVAAVEADLAASKEESRVCGWPERMEALKTEIDALEDGEPKKNALSAWQGQATASSRVKEQRTQVTNNIASMKSMGRVVDAPTQVAVAPQPQPAEIVPATAGIPLTTVQRASINNASGPVAVTSPASNANEATAGEQKATVANSTNASARPNPLHAYPSYTYGISLHLLTIEDYNTIVEKGEYTPSHVLVASAGRWNAQKTGANAFGRAPEFGEDFYFSNLHLTTIIGLGERNRATNAIDMTFTLIEPYGMTFLDRLIEASKIVGGSYNYLDNPYLIQIDFFGTDDDGNVQSPIPNITKRMPIKILTCGVKLTHQGTEYQIAAQPYSHQAFNESNVNTKINLQLTAGTVGGLLVGSDTGANDLAAQVADAGGERTRRGVIVGRDGQEVPVAGGGITTDIAAFNKAYSADQVYKAKSYADALNAYEIQIEKTTAQKEANRYSFNVHPTIAIQPMYDSEKTATPANAPMADVGNTQDIRQANAGALTAALNLNQRTFPIQKGDSIDSVVTLIIRNSQYILSQLTDKNAINKNLNAQTTELLNKENETVKWFKIIPKIKLRKFDIATNVFAKDITYEVLPYEIFNVKIEEAPQGKAKHNDAVKQYNYIYTGKNDDIINVDLKFDAMYFLSRTAFTSREMSNAGVAGQYADDGLSCNVVQTQANQNTITPTQVKIGIGDERTRAAGGAKTAKEVIAADLASSLMALSGADMLVVDLTIVGDPEFIKQDDMFYPNTYDVNGQVELQTHFITPNGSLVMDTKEIFCNLTFKTPVDINEDNGLMTFDPKYKGSGFSGLYKINQVGNDFNNGKFTQVLNLIRYPNQDTPATASKESSNQRSETTGQTPTAGTALINQTGTPIAKVAAAEDLVNEAKTEVGTVTPSGIDPKLAAIKADGSTTAITDANAPAAVAPTTAKTIGDIAAANLEINRNISSLDSLITTNQNSLLGARGALDILKIKSADVAAIAAAQGRVNELQNSIKLLQTARTELASKLQATP